MEVTRAPLDGAESCGAFPGAVLVCAGDGNYSRSGRRYELIYCRRGRVELDGGAVLHQGDMLVRGPEDRGGLSVHGGCIALLADEAAPGGWGGWDEIPPHELLRRLSAGGEYILRCRAGTEHIFAGLGEVPERERPGYFRIKARELLLVLRLGSERKTNAQSAKPLPGGIGAYIEDRLGERLTISSLAEAFHTSPTRIKTGFRGVYGISVSRYIRERKMHRAAALLRCTDKTVLEIAGSIGYDNGSKFAAAFRETMGLTPNEYRKSLSPRSAPGENVRSEPYPVRSERMHGAR